MAGAAPRLYLFNPIDPACLAAGWKLALRMAMVIERPGCSSAKSRNSSGVARASFDTILNLFPPSRQDDGR